MRSRPLLIWLLLLLLQLFAVGCDEVPPLASLGPEAVVLAYGDSLTRGTGADAGEDYPSLLGGMLERTVINAGVPGELSAEGLERLPGVLARYQPELVVLCHGGNDFLRRLDRQKTAANLAAMIEQIRDSGAEVVLVGVPQPGFGLAIPEFYQQLAERYAIPYEDSILLDLLGDRDMKSDAIHPNATGYRLMAEAIYELICKAQGG
jgi:lysophospholipase L1-like esterase